MIFIECRILRFVNCDFGQCYNLIEKNVEIYKNGE